MSFEADSEREPLTSEQEAQVKQVVMARAAQALAKFDGAKDDAGRFHALPNAAVAAFHLDRDDLAAQLAAEVLAMAPAFERDWNYGNALHAGHTVLGLLALRAGDRQLAVQELLRAGATPGSPQLGSFGPTMQLAKALLGAGESDAVLGYLTQCRSFWKMGGAWLDVWEQKIRDGGVPNCYMHLW